MPKVKGKVQLCVCDRYQTYFKSFQGVEGTNFSLFDRYSDIENVVNKNIDERYRHFLAQPEIDGDSIFWYSTPYRDDTPRPLTTLTGEEHDKYEQLKNDTLKHYRDVAQALRQQAKHSEAECLEKATKFVNDNFVYCYDDKVVLGVWGMQLRDNIREASGVIVKASTFKAPRPRSTALEAGPPEAEQETEQATDSPDDIPSTDEPPTASDDEPALDDEPEKRCNVRFEAGENGVINGTSQYFKPLGDIINENEVPEVVPHKGWHFVRWDKEPINHTVDGDIVFTALYERDTTTQTNDDDENTAGGNCNWFHWLLLLLLLALIFMVIWCCFLEKCNICLCCHDSTSVLVQDTTDLLPPPQPQPDDELEIVPEPVKPCNAQVKSGGYEGYAGTFDMGQNSGTFVFDYNTHTQPDEITIYDGENINGNVIFHYPMGGTDRPLSANVDFNSQKITVKVVGSDEGTVWDFVVNCPN